MINGRRYDWESIQVSLPQGTLVDVQKIEYSDEKEFKPVYGKGSMPRGHGAGNYKAEGKLTLLREEYERLLAAARAAKTPLYRLPPFPITVSYSNPDEPTVTDRLHQCKLKKTGTGSDQGAEKTEVELEFHILGGIEWNGVAADVNP